MSSTPQSSLSLAIDNHPAGSNNLLASDVRRQGQQTMIRISMGNMVFLVCGVTSLGQLFVLNQGGTGVDVGLLTAVISVAPLWQIVGTSLVGRMGKARLLSVGTFAVTIAMLLLALLALWGKGGHAGICLTLLGFGLAMSLLQIAHTPWWPILQDITDGEAKGEFFAKLRTRLRLVEVLLPLGVGAYLGKEPSTRMFALPFFIAAMASFFVSRQAKRLPERPVIVRRRSLVVRLRLAGRVESVRRYVWLLLQHSFILSLVGPFWVVMLKRLGMPDSQVVWMTMITAIGHVASLKPWTWAVDRHGARSVIGLSILGMAGMGLLWLVIPFAPSLLLWGAVYYLLWGGFSGGLLMGKTYAQLEAVPQKYQSESFTLVGLFSAVGGTVGTLLGAMLFELIRRAQIEVPMDGRLLYLAVGQLAVLLTLPAKSRLAGHDRQTSPVLSPADGR